MSLTLAKWNIDEYHQMIEAGILDNRRVELINGEIVEMSPEGEAHAYFSSEAQEYLRQLLRDRASIRSGKPITLPNNSEPEPDIAIVQKLGREYLAHHPYAENIFWLIEYSNSSLKKDLEIKTKIYAQVGIAEYWIVNVNYPTPYIYVWCGLPVSRRCLVLQAIFGGDGSLRRPQAVRRPACIPQVLHSVQRFGYQLMPCTLAVV